MHTNKRDFFITVLKIGDILAMLLALALSMWFTEISTSQTPLLWEVLQQKLTATNIILMLVFLPLWHLIFLSVGLYDAKLFEPSVDEVKDLIKAVLIGSMLLLIMTVFFQRTNVDKYTVLYFAGTACLFTWLGRALAGAALGLMYRRRRNLCHLLLVGSNQRAYDFACRIMTKPRLGYHVVGYVDAPPNGQSYHKLQVLLKHLGTPEELDIILDRETIDEVVISLPIRSCYEQIKGLISACEIQGIRVHLLSDFFELTIARAHPAEFDGIPIITLSSGTVAVWPVYLKRAFDLVVSACLVLLFLPLFLLIALCLKISAPRDPVFFIQTRIGHNRRRFKMLKFRTMVRDAEQRQAELEHLNEAQGPVFKIKDDPRVTKFGHFLRKTSLDELPQLFNVIKGDMSLVGPRPLPRRDVELFEEAWLKRRFSVKPGLTCLWQINGRSDTTFNTWIAQDLEYIDHWSFTLDLKILFKTIPAVLRGTGAQ